MNAPHDYRPALRSQDLPEYVPAHANESVPKYQRALIYRDGLPPIKIEHAARGHAFALVYFGKTSRWRLRSTAQSVDALATDSQKLDALQRRWRIVDVISAEIVAEG